MISHSKTWLGIAIVAAFLAIAGVIALARRERQDPARCATGFLPSGAYCKPSGGCPPEFVSVDNGCVCSNIRIRYAGGQLDLGASDWEREQGPSGRRANVSPFELDSLEVTLTRWRDCVRANVCRALSIDEPGVPVSNVAPDEAAAFCKLAGGRLPSADEWLFAAGGGRGRRFPWGQSGLVCRRAAFGLIAGPCAHGATGPELAGSRPDGRSPEGAYDLSGNVAEWAVEPDGSWRAHGGSFRSLVATELKTGSEESAAASVHVGFRCAYDVR